MEVQPIEKVPDGGKRERVFVPKEDFERVEGERPLIRKEQPGPVHIIEGEVIIIQDGFRVSDVSPEMETDMRALLEAKLRAHTELLGELDASAARRLEIVTKGVAQQDIDMRDDAEEKILHRFEADLHDQVEAGELPPEIAKQILGEMRRDIPDGFTSSAVIADPLYQQAIKDVLSEDALAAYYALQTERADFAQQSLRDLAVASLDMQLLLNDSQRQHLEKAAAVLSTILGQRSGLDTEAFLQLFRRENNFSVLTPWQQAEFERVFAPLIWAR